MKDTPIRLVTVLTSMHLSELSVICGRLEADGIECHIQDELTAQVNPFYSNAIGGIKLQVEEKDLQKALAVLRSHGYITERDMKPLPLITELDSFSSRLPFLKGVRLEVRLVVIVAIISAIITLFVYVLTLPSVFRHVSTNGAGGGTIPLLKKTLTVSRA
ncbi:MAG TPA: DUF2007 domain-containing protein [Bacteroidia bacterium]|nr:DUF2007 domain-containing protein [Bacteroidia bacterium]